MGIVLPTLATSLLTMYYPLISLYIRDIIRNREIQSMAQDPEAWDDDWVKGYAAFEDQQRQRTWREERQQQSAWSSSYQGGGDPKGYYRALGVSSSASQSDIQSAFRGYYHQSLYIHPYFCLI